MPSSLAALSSSSRVAQDGEKYNSMIGAVYIFNLIVGTGALTIPAAFDHAGWILSSILISILAFLSYITATFVVESMSSTNAILRWQLHQGTPEADKTASADSDEVFIEANEEAQLLSSPADSNDTQSGSPTNSFDIRLQVEMGQMAGMFFNKAGLIAFYLVICVYLFGDLAIYATAISKTLRDITCFSISDANDTMDNGTMNISEDAICWTSLSVTRLNVYRLFLVWFIMLLGPFAFFNVQKTESLQLMTTLLRWLAFAIMVALASMHLASSDTNKTPKTINYAGLPNLFGVCVYSFMCHHSLPSIVTPIRGKQRLYTVIAFDYIMVLVFYMLIALTAVFSFDTIRDLYTLNFEPNPASSRHVSSLYLVIEYFLSLFPVFTLGANFPIVAITLRNNLRELATSLGYHQSPSSVGAAGHRDQSSVHLYALCAIIPPILVALVTENLEVLIGFTGSFAGVGVQYVIPTALVLLSRAASQRTIGASVKNRHVSPFQHKAWAYFILVWTALCVFFILMDYTLIGL